MKGLAGRTRSLAIDRACIHLVGWMICVISLLVVAQAPAATTQYYYDDLGRIVQSVRSDGAIHQYQYDGTGNVLAINRVAPNTVSISGITPRIGHAGASVTIYGSGFSTTLSANQVHFGTGATTPVAATVTSLTVIVPQDAVTGPVSVTVGGVTAVSAMSYTVRRPEITSFSPVAIASGGQVSLSGTNLNIIPGETSIRVSGTAASLSAISNSAAIFNVTAATTSGPIEVVTPYGSAQTSSPLLVNPPVTATSVAAAADLVSGGPAQTFLVSESYKYVVVRFRAVEGQHVTAHVSDFAPANLTLSYTFYSPTNQQLQSATVYGNAASVHLQAIPATGTYWLVFRASNPTVQFTVRLALATTIETTGALASSATTATGQSQRFTFQGAAGDSLGLAITGVSTNPTDGSASVAVYSPDGESLKTFTCAPAALPGCRTELRDLSQTGTYTITVRAESNPARTISFGLNLSQHITGSLALGIPLNLNLNVPGQYAKLTFTATAGQTLALGTTQLATTPADKSVGLAVLDANGASVASNAHVAGPMLNLRDLAAGTYAAIFNTADAATASMQVLLASGVVGALPSDGTTSVYSTALNNQAGYFTFSGAAGQSFGLAITNPATLPTGSSIDVTVRRPTGAIESTMDCDATDVPGCQVELGNLPATGTYHVTVTPNARTKMSFGLTLSEHIAGTLTLNTPVSVSLVPGQYAKYTFTATAGQSVSIRATQVVTTPSSEKVKLILRGPSGNLLTTHSSASAPAVNWGNLVAGAHTVLVSVEDAATVTMQLTMQ